MVKAIFVDMDNTLIETQVLYEEAHRTFATHVEALTGVSAATINDTLNKKQIELFDTLGYSALLVPQAYEDTFKYFVQDASVEDIQDVRNFSKLIFEREAEIKAGVETAIALLAQHYPVYLVTVGDQAVQQSRVDVLPFKDIFAGIFIVDHKNAETYKQVLQTVNVKAKDAVMIGDSLNSDILPALQNGMKAIHIPAANWTMRENDGASLPEKGVTVHVSFVEATYALTKLKTATPKPKRSTNGPR